MALAGKVFCKVFGGVRTGDLLVTSGLGGKFPPGYPVATVTRIDRSPDAPFSTIIAQPSAHLDRSREVLLVWTVPNQLEIPDEDLATGTAEVDGGAAPVQAEGMTGGDAPDATTSAETAPKPAQDPLR